MYSFIDNKIFYGPLNNALKQTRGKIKPEPFKTIMFEVEMPVKDKTKTMILGNVALRDQIWDEIIDD